MSAVDVCNNALGLIGHTIVITALDARESAEARSCARLFPGCLAQALARGDWSFARRDELINRDGNFLTDIKSYPWKYTYKLPDDVGKVFSLVSVDADSFSSTWGNSDSAIRFDLRNVDDKRYLLTDVLPDFVIHYQAKTVSLDVCPPMFVEGLEYLLASRLAPEFVKSNVGLNMGLQLLKVSEGIFSQALVDDLNQGAYSQKNVSVPSLIRSRY